MAFTTAEFHSVRKLSKKMGCNLHSTFPKKTGVYCIKDFRSISIIGSIYKILANIPMFSLQNVGLHIISLAQGVFVHGGEFSMGSSLLMNAVTLD